MSLVRSAITVGFLTLISRILGYVRDIFIAAWLGAGPVADAFFVAFRLPNFFRRLFAEGAFSAAFVPMFAGKLAVDGKASAKEFADKVLTLLLLILLLFTALMEMMMPLVMLGIAPGFAQFPEKFELSVMLARITMPYLLFISLVSLFGGILNSVGRFAAAAASPILLNFCMVAAIAGFSQVTATPAHALSWGVMMAGIIQVIAIIVSCRRAGFMPRLSWPIYDKEVNKMLRNMLPGILAIGVVQINLWVDTIIATFLQEGAVSYLYYADRLSQLPLALIGTAIGTVLLPTLSKHLREGKRAEALLLQNRALEIGLLLTLPCAAALLAIAAPIISVLFERGLFTSYETENTALTLMALGAGLPAFVLLKILTPPFLAEQDTKTPVLIAIGALLLNILLNLLFMPLIAHAAGIALATSLSSWMNVMGLSWVARKRGLLKLDDQLCQRFPRMLVALLIMIGVLYVLKYSLIGALQSTHVTHKIMALAVLVGLGGGSYIGSAWLLRIFSWKECISALKRKPVSLTSKEP